MRLTQRPKTPRQMSSSRSAKQDSELGNPAGNLTGLPGRPIHIRPVLSSRSSEGRHSCIAFLGAHDSRPPQRPPF